MSGNARLKFDYDQFFEVAVLKGKIVLPKQTVLHEPIFVWPVDFSLLFLQFLLERSIQKLQLEQSRSQVADWEPFVHCFTIQMNYDLTSQIIMPKETRD